MFTLDEKHLEAAKKIAHDHRKKKRCDECYDRGWIGVSEQNLLVLCTRCVEMDAAMEDWKKYVSEHEELKEHFKELFEEAPSEAEEEEVHPAQQEYEHKKSHPANQTAYVPGPKRTGRAKKI
ncbi:MAG: hypothetical protein RBR69_06560 [Candidatus Cloacimonadaceae bacterium]|jgi:archaellum component FlaD/FlaE|nr:hypothetical protein [Candidatus Cloacimonadota bacterium]MDY0127775.1 hypothetical protein [Candidatus Cloacimonadaceae bacterium]MCB5254659.1 hypothetical protein [Candidatus Cloacimonadota bacterium]MCK9178156.1 hypothetical protein [Candidatus Cloacimonadota bacterium]MCK9242021.1 hypothetical protein [Candidatus Cloacimonadota bacterium]